jgi:hypothetical protein
MSAIVLVAGWTVATAKVAAVITGLVAMFTAAVTGHSVTDVMATKATTTKPTEEEAS